MNEIIEQSIQQQTYTMLEQRELVYDCEVYPNFFIALFYEPATGMWFDYTLCDQLLNDIIRNPNITLIGFNNSKYDDLILKYIDEFSHEDSNSGYFGKEKISEQHIYKLSCEIIQNKDMTANVRRLMFKDAAFKSIDLKSLLDPLPGLKKLELRMNYHTVADLPVEPHAELTPEQKQNVTTYCRNDVMATLELHKEHATDHIELRKFLANKFNLPDKQRVLSMSEPKTAETILAEKYRVKTGEPAWQIKQNLHPVTTVFVDECIPPWVKFITPYMTEKLNEIKEQSIPINPVSGYPDGKNFKQIIDIGNRSYQFGIGGLHSIDAPGLFIANDQYSIIDSDVTSYYPSILLVDGLYPRGYGIQWNQIYREIYEERLAAKSDPTQATNAQALKIILNATFGKLGSQYSSFYDPTVFLHITITGQLALLMLIEMMDQSGIETLSANTDGILTRVHKRNDLDHLVLCQTWEKNTHLNLEHTRYARYARRDVNSYMALTEDGKVKNKGKFIEPDIKHDVKAPVIQTMVRRALLFDESPRQYIFRARKELNLYDFLFSYSAPSNFDVYIFDQGTLIPEPQKGIKLSRTNRWYISKTSTLQLKKIGGKLGNTISIPDANRIDLMNVVDDESLPSQLDYDYYIDQAQQLIDAVRNKAQ